MNKFCGWCGYYGNCTIAPYNKPLDLVWICEKCTTVEFPGYWIHE